MTQTEMQAEALSRAQHGQSVSNYPAIFAGFMARGIRELNIVPRENVFTYRAWQGKGRQVRKGEKGVRVTTYVPIKEKRNGAGVVTRRASTWW